MIPFDNDKIIDWSKRNLSDIKSEISSLGIKHRPGSPSPKSLQNSITLTTRTRAGFTDKISYGMPRSGVFVHKGVGRGHPISNPREGKKWFDIPTNKNLPDLQNMVAESSVDYVINNLNIK